jgi:spore coat protein CotH
MLQKLAAGLAAALLCVVVLDAQQLIGSAPPPAPGAKAAAGDQIFQTTKLHRIHVTMPAGEWSVLQTSQARGAQGGRGTDYTDQSGRLIHIGGGFGGYFPWGKATLRIEDGGRTLEFKDVGIRYKGNLSFQRSSAAAPLAANFKVKLDVHGTKGTWDGIKTFNFHYGNVDASKMRDVIAYSLFRAAGVPAPRTAHAELIFTVPGVYDRVSAGTFAFIEDVNNTFLERVMAPGKGLLMKPEGTRGGIQNLGDTWSSYSSIYKPDRDATPAEQQRLIGFAQLISQPEVTRFRHEIRQYLDVDAFLRFIAVHALISNTDSYLGGSHNYYLYLDPRDNRFRFIPWDQDLSLGARFGTGGGPTGIDIRRPWTGDNPLIYWVLDDPANAARYREIMGEIATKYFNEKELLKLADTLEKIGSGRGPSPREHLISRARYVQETLASWK